MARACRDNPDSFPDAHRFSYDPESGVVFRDGVPAGRAYQGGTAGGYVRFKHAGKLWMAHRVAWFLHFGRWPDKDIDHIDGDRSNNRISNLRPADRRQNMANVGKHVDNTSGYRGVSPRRLKDGSVVWAVYARFEERNKFLGTFAEVEDAAIAYDNFIRETRGDFAKLNLPAVADRRPIPLPRIFRGNQWTQRKTRELRRPVRPAHVAPKQISMLLEGQK